MSSPILPHPYPSRHGSPSGIYVQPGKKGLDKTTGPQQYTVGFKIFFPSLVRSVCNGKERWVIICCPSVCVCVCACAYQRESAFLSNAFPDTRNTIAFLEVSQSSLQRALKWSWVRSTVQWTLTGENGSTGRKTCLCHFVHHKFRIDWPCLNNCSKSQAIPHRKHASFLWQRLISYYILAHIFCVHI